MKNLDASSSDVSSDQKPLGRRAQQRANHARDLKHYWNGEVLEDKGGFLATIRSITPARLAAALITLELPDTYTKDDLVCHWELSKMHIRGKIDDALNRVR